MRRPTPPIILAVIAFGVFVAADDLTVVSTMLRQIIFDLGIPLPDGLDDAAWIVNAYLIAYVVVMPFVGRLSDVLGRRAVYVASLALFLAGSIWLPLARDLPTFIAGRVLTALGGGAMVPVGMAVIADIFARERRPSALGVLAAVDTAGWVWGTLYGALLIRFLSWRWQFYLNVPLSLLGIAAAWWALRDLPRPQKRESIDWPGMALLSAGLLALNIALLDSSDIQSVGSLAGLENERAIVWPYYLAAALCLALFVVVERRVRQPLIEPGLFGRPNFSPAVVVNFLVGMVLIIAMINVPLLINVVELEVEAAALRSGWLLSAMTGAMALTSYLGGLATERLSYRPVALAGLLLIAAGFGLMGATWRSTTSYGLMAGQLALLGAGFGLVTAPIGAAVINAAGESQRGIAASLVIVLRLIGMSVGLSGLTAWGLYRFNILRLQVELPPISDPAFQEALVAGLTNTTVAVLAETFIISAAIALLALLAASRLHRH
jgi:EmrB/QacA subfamily drug resistance transporter